MRVLITVASKHGSTREIADIIASELRAQQLEVDLREPGKIDDLTGYDIVILGSAIYAGHWLPEAKRFAEQHHAELSRLPVWLFSSGPLGADDHNPANDPKLLAAPLGDIPVRGHRIFSGKLDSRELGLGERLIAKVMHAPAGDFREWEEIRAYVREIAAAYVPVPAE
jgi:menaquinone-dependent protoporphyrinogen oxidase